MIQGVLSPLGLSLHRKDAIDRALRELSRLKASAAPLDLNTPLMAPIALPAEGADAYLRLRSEYERALERLDHYEGQAAYLAAAEDDDLGEKQLRVVDQIAEFGRSDFAELSGWLFASNLTNHRVVHQRIDEGSLLWRATKMSGGPILEIGRAAGGSTAIILGASGDRPVVSIDRNPSTSNMATHVFARPDVKKRLTLMTQSSREPIASSALGMMFVDGDHSYEGVCHDIAMYWNLLQPFDGKRPMAVFHDAAFNPISYSEDVKRACDELIAGKGVAKVLESWGSMLVLEKTGDIDQERWFTKESAAFWKPYGGVIRPGRSSEAPNASSVLQTWLSQGTENLLGGEDLDDPSWVKVGAVLESIHGHADNPLRFARETPVTGLHGVEKSVAVAISRFVVTFFLRPIGRRALRVAVLDRNHEVAAKADFQCAAPMGVVLPESRGGVLILDTAIAFRNGYFRCDLAVETEAPIGEILIAAYSLSASGEPEFMGDAQRGFVINLANVRAAM